MEIKDNTWQELYDCFDFLLDSGILNENEKQFYRKVSADMEAYTATEALKVMSGFLMRYYGKHGAAGNGV